MNQRNRKRLERLERASGMDGLDPPEFLVIRYVDKNREEVKRMIIKLGAGRPEEDDGPKNGLDTDARKRDYETA